MKGDFDFESFGKKTPYRTPDHFFEDMQDKVVNEVKHAHSKRRRVKWSLVVSMALAAMIAGIVFLPFSWNEKVSDKRALPISSVVGMSDTMAMNETQQHSLPIKKVLAKTAPKEAVEKVVRKKEANTAEVSKVAATSNDNEWIQQLSDDDLNSLVNLNDNDILLI